MMNFDFELQDRIAKIKAINEQYDLEKNAYISFSGGKDSTILHYLIDLALHNNNIPRLFMNTGIEYKFIVDFVKGIQSKDNRFVILNSGVNVKDVLEKYGYPFKSKQHSYLLNIYWNNKEYTKSVKSYLGLESNTHMLYRCPKKLEYQFTSDFKLHCSDKCCYKMKKEPAKKWAKEHNKSIILTGMRKSEGGLRLSANCVAIKNNQLLKFHPLFVVSSEFEEEFIKRFNIELCKLYYEPYNFERTGCKGCPFNVNLESQLEIMKDLLPNEYKQCEVIWKPVYDEYRRIKYRLK